jgi:hypothetical protein
MRNQLEGDTWRKQGITQSSDDNPEVTHQGMRPLCFVTHRRKITERQSFIREGREKGEEAKLPSQNMVSPSFYAAV